MTANKKPTKSRPNVSLEDISLLHRYCKDTHFVVIMQTLSKVFNRILLFKIKNRVKDNNSSTKRQESQLKRVKNCFAETPKTMLQVARETNILRANVCRYVATLRKSGSIQFHHRGIDSFTHHPASFLTTNPALFKQSMFNQLNLFE